MSERRGFARQASCHAQVADPLGGGCTGPNTSALLGGLSGRPGHAHMINGCPGDDRATDRRVGRSCRRLAARELRRRRLRGARGTHPDPSVTGWPAVRRASLRESSRRAPSSVGREWHAERDRGPVLEARFGRARGQTLASLSGRGDAPIGDSGASHSDAPPSPRSLLPVMGAGTRG